jgi:hypothetical protein
MFTEIQPLTFESTYSTVALRLYPNHNPNPTLQFIHAVEDKLGCDCFTYSLYCLAWKSHIEALPVSFHKFWVTLCRMGRYSSWEREVFPRNMY